MRIFQEYSWSRDQEYAPERGRLFASFEAAERHFAAAGATRHFDDRNSGVRGVKWYFGVTPEQVTAIRKANNHWTWNYDLPDGAWVAEVDEVEVLD